MKDNLVLFLTHYDDYLDICIGLTDNNQDIKILHDNIKKELRSNKLSQDEYIKKDADIFYQYLQKIKVI
jgi:hypothetical protein